MPPEPMSNDVHASLQDLSHRMTEVTGGMMRTREDMAEMKAESRATGAAVARIEQRHDKFEAEMRTRLEETHRRNNERMIEIAREQSLDWEAKLGQVLEALEGTNTELRGVKGRVDTIERERIAEKSQWRGPEKLIALLQVGVMLAAIGTFGGKIMGWW